jgi:hypothetical protein
MLVTLHYGSVTFGEQFQSKVVGSVAIKDRGAILPVGHWRRLLVRLSWKLDNQFILQKRTSDLGEII